MDARGLYVSLGESGPEAAAAAAAATVRARRWCHSHSQSQLGAGADAASEGSASRGLCTVSSLLLPRKRTTANVADATKC